jgi:hypothetical protein
MTGRTRRLLAILTDATQVGGEPAAIIAADEAWPPIRSRYGTRLKMAAGSRWLAS